VLQLAGVFFTIAVLVPAGTAGASTLNAAAAVPVPSVLAVSAAPSALSFDGGKATVNGRVRNAATCQLRLMSHQGFPVVFASNSRRCSSTFSARMTIGANPTTVPRTVAFELVARKGNKSSAYRFFITLGPRPAPHVTPDGRRSPGGTVSGQATFTKAVGSPGPEWSAMTDGGLAVVNQKLTGTTGGTSGDIRTAESYTSDQFSRLQLTSTQLTGSQWVGPAVRAQAGGKDLYVGMYYWDNGRPKLMLFLRDNGSWDQLANMTTGMLAAGTTLTLTVVGSTLAFAVNNTTVLSTTDTTLSGGAPGVVANGLASATNWSGGNSGFQVEYQGAASGIQTYDFLSPEDGYGIQTLRVLQPTHPAAGVAHNFLFVLPVEAGLGNTYGDGLETLQALDAEDQYNLTIVEPTFADQPWYDDNPNDPNLRYESFMVNELVPWVDSALATTGAEQNWLIGFSKSGYGGQDLILRNPGVFSVAASWDFPADMSSYDYYGSSPATAYGTEANFANNYQLSSAFVAAHSTPFMTKDRIWLGGYGLYPQDMADYESLLTSQGVVYTAGPMQLVAHSWDSGWVPAAVAALYQDSLSLPPGP
jgi:hypothetical protein